MRLGGVLRSLAALVCTTALADARIPESPARSSRGLDAPVDRAAPHGVVALRVPAQGKVRLPGGSFIMGSTPPELEDALELCRREIESSLCANERMVQAFLFETVAHMVTLRSFAIDRTEVAVADYDRCVSSGGCARAGFPLGDPHFDRPELPVTFVSWDDAKTYCAFAGGRLPTEAEWEFAARGVNRRIFPWGDVYNPHLANHGALYSAQTTDTTDGYETLAPVDAFLDGATPEGILQMAGNVSEWVADFFSFDLNAFGYSGAPASNPTGPATGIAHLTRGGSYAHGAAWLRSAARFPETGPSPELGFRCVYDK